MLAQAVSRCSSARDMDLSARSDKSQCPPPPWTHLCPLYKGTLGGEGGWSEVCQAFLQQYLSCHQLCWLVSFPKGIPSGDSSWFLQTSVGLWSGVSNIPCSSLYILYQLKTFKMHFVSCCVMSPLDVPLPPLTELRLPKCQVSSAVCSRHYSM